MSALAIFNFLGMWNEYLLALVILIEPEKQTMQLGIANMVVALNYRSDWGTLLATAASIFVVVLAQSATDSTMHQSLSLAVDGASETWHARALVNAGGP